MISGLGVARAFNEDFDFAISEAGDGVRLDRGLLQRRHETIPYGRIQAVRVVEPFFWRAFGWARLEVDVARQSVSREADRDAQQVARTLIPVASRDQALWLLARVMPDAHPNPPPDAGPPSRARLKAPLSFHFLAAWFGQRYVYARTGRVQKSTIIVPLVKVQSVRLKSGPLQRAFHVATVDVDTAGRRWQASARCRDEARGGRDGAPHQRARPPVPAGAAATARRPRRAGSGCRLAARPWQYRSTDGGDSPVRLRRRGDTDLPSRRGDPRRQDGSRLSELRLEVQGPHRDAVLAARRPGGDSAEHLEGGLVAP